MTPIQAFELLLTVFVFSQLLYKDTILFRFATTTALAVAIGNAAVQAVNSLNKAAYIPILNGKIILILPVILGLALLTTLSKKYAWMSRTSYGIMLAVGTGTIVRGAMLLYIRDNVLYVINPIFGGPTTPLDNFVIILFVTSIVTYFLFTIEQRQKGSLRYFGDFGRYAIMFGLGTSLGIATVTRLSWLGARMAWILNLLGIA
ncbi:MAG: hypothetical protein ACFFDT_04480 [Candidatus Hodarchaeota archaeon]